MSILSSAIRSLFVSWSVLMLFNVCVAKSLSISLISLECLAFPRFDFVPASFAVSLLNGICYSMLV